MAYHLYDGDRWTEFASYDAAEDAASDAVDAYRDCCDPEWSHGVEEIAIYDAPAGCEDPDEDGVLVAHSKMVNEQDAEEGDGVDFWCDYVIAQVAARAQEKNDG